MARATGILKLLGLAEHDLLLPSVDRHFFFDQLGKTFPAQGTRRASVEIHKTGQEVLHVIELLDRACSSSSS